MLTQTHAVQGNFDDEENMGSTSSASVGVENDVILKTQLN